MFGSMGVPKDLNFLFPVASSDRDKDHSEADPHHAHHHHQQQHHQQQQEQQYMGSGLVKYKSAPSNLLGEVYEELVPHRSTNPEAASMFPRFMGGDQSLREHVSEKQGQAPVTRDQIPCSFTQLLFHSPHRQQHHDAQITGMSSMGLEHSQSKGDHTLLRHSSSPAVPVSRLPENGSGGNRLKTQISFSSRQGSSGFMSQISEISGEAGSDDSPEENRIGYAQNYPMASWEDSLMLTDGFNIGKRGRGEPLGDCQNGETRNHGSSSEYIAFQESVPWKLRAKRGCATHPRSIAERVRRTKISERIRKLQELVPNMDKQTSTADMLDLAVEYVKELQDQIKRLAEIKASCKCQWK